MTVRPLVIAHRGASYAAPENTLPAFSLAWDLGADGVECDVRLTADGEVVCVHDADTSRVSTQTLEIASHSYAELKAVDVGAWKHERFAGTVMPLLSELLAQIPSEKQVFVEVKCGVEILVPLVEVIEASTIDLQLVTVIAFDPAVVSGLKAKMPELRVYLLLDVRTDARGRSELPLKRTLKKLIDLRADGLGLGAHRGISRTITQAFTQAHLGLNIWTVDDVAEAQRLAKLGVSSITSNRPDEILWAL